MEPDFLALFGLQALLQIEGAKKAVLLIVKHYVEKKELGSIDDVVHVVETLFPMPGLEQEVLDYIVFQQQKKDDEGL